KPGNGQITLTWTESAGASGYRIKRSLSGGGPYTEVGLTGLPSYVDNTVTNGVAYYYVVTAFNPGGESPNSVELAGIPVGGPTSLVALVEGKTTIVLTWLPATEPGIVGYNVYRAGSAGGPFARLNFSVLTATKYSDSGLNVGTYFYVVRSQNGAGVETG